MEVEGDVFSWLELPIAGDYTADVGMCIRRGNVYDFQVASPVMEEQVGRFAFGDLVKMNLYSDKKENLANCIRPTEGSRTSTSDTLPEFDVSGGMLW